VSRTDFNDLALLVLVARAGTFDSFAAPGDSLRFGAGAEIGTDLTDLTEADRPTTLDDARAFTRVTEG
jgi:hypothetical protein